MAPRRRSTSRRATRRRAPRYSRPAVVRRRRTYRRAQPCVCPGDLSPGAKFALAQLDPFDVKCFGAKIPDSNTLPSIAQVDTDIVTHTSASTTSWFAATAYRPQYRGGTIVGVPSAGGVTWGTTYADLANNRQKYVQYAAAIELTRPVAHAIRISSQVAPTTATGFVHVGIATEALSKPTWDYPTNPNEMAGLQFYRRVTLASLTQTPLTVINKWLDDTGFRYSSSLQSLTNDGAAGAAADPQNTLFNTDYGWGAIIVMVEGVPGPSTNVLSVEHILLSEGIPKRTGVLIGTQAASNSPSIMSAVNHVSVNQEPFHTEAEQDSYIAQGISAIVEGAREAGGQAFEQVGKPLMRQFGHVLMNKGTQYAINAAMGLGGIAGVNSNAKRLAIGH